MNRWEFLVAIATASHALACGQAAPGAGTGGTHAPSGGKSGQGGAEAAGSGGGNAGATSSGSTNATGGAPSGGGATGGSGSVNIWTFNCGDPSLPDATGARAGSADFSPNSETGANEPHVLYLNGYFLIRRTRQYVTEGETDHQHEILLTDEQIDALIGGNSIVVETNGPPLNASSGHGHTITIRSCFLM